MLFTLKRIASQQTADCLSRRKEATANMYMLYVFYLTNFIILYEDDFAMLRNLVRHPPGWACMSVRDLYKWLHPFYTFPSLCFMLHLIKFDEHWQKLRYWHARMCCSRLGQSGRKSCIWQCIMHIYIYKEFSWYIIIRISYDGRDGRFPEELKCLMMQM